MEVRDKFLAEEDRLEVPGSDANREFMTQVHEKQLAEGGNPYSNKPLNQKVGSGTRVPPLTCDAFNVYRTAVLPIGRVYC